METSGVARGPVPNVQLCCLLILARVGRGRETLLRMPNGAKDANLRYAFIPSHTHFIIPCRIFNRSAHGRAGEGDLSFQNIDIVAHMSADSCIFISNEPLILLPHWRYSTLDKFCVRLSHFFWSVNIIYSKFFPIC